MNFKLISFGLINIEIMICDVKMYVIIVYYDLYEYKIKEIV